MPKPTPPPADDPTAVNDTDLPTLDDPPTDDTPVGPGPDFHPGDYPAKAPSDLPDPSRTSNNPASTVHYYEVNGDLTVKTWMLHDRPDLWNVTVIRPDSGKARTDIPQVPSGYLYDLDAAAKDALVAELLKLATP